jgi:hypothetical protein
VAIGRLDPAAAWPEFFASPDDSAVPAADADMTGFEWEHPTPESFENDLAAVMAASEHVSMRESPDPPQPSERPPLTSADLEWT